MPDALAVAIAKATTAHIATMAAAKEFCQEFTLQRSYADWDRDLSNMDELALRESDKLLVDVVAHTTEQKVELAARGVAKFIVPVDIAVRKKFGADKQNDDTGRVAIEAIDGLMLLTQQLSIAVTARRLAAADFQYTVWDNENGGTRVLVAPNRQHLRDLRQFTSIIRTFLRGDVSLT